VQEGDERKKRGRNGDGRESDLGFQIGYPFITKATKEACNSPPKCAWIFGLMEG
jgi:hypothetical protein